MPRPPLGRVAADRAPTPDTDRNPGDRTPAKLNPGAPAIQRRRAPLVDEPPALDWTSEEQVPVGVL